MKYNRQKEMLSYIENHKSVRNEELLDKFNISIQTLRRDITKLEELGYIDKVYGGVIYNDKQEAMSKVDSLAKRDSSFSQEKEHIGKIAASLVDNGDVIFIDSGTTAYRMLHYLKESKNVTVITHCLDVLNLLREMPNITGICLGGVLQHDSGTFALDSTFYPYNYNKAFISAVGVSINRSLTNTNLYEGAMKSQVINQANSVYVLVDHSKFDIVAYNHFADFSSINGIVTDKKPNDNFMRFFENRHIKVLY